MNGLEDQFRGEVDFVYLDVSPEKVRPGMTEDEMRRDLEAVTRLESN